MMYDKITFTYLSGSCTAEEWTGRRRHAKMVVVPVCPWTPRPLAHVPVVQNRGPGTADERVVERTYRPGA